MNNAAQAQQVELNFIAIPSVYTARRFDEGHVARFSAQGPAVNGGLAPSG
jgi:hypothetical protein